MSAPVSLKQEARRMASARLCFVCGGAILPGNQQSWFDYLGILTHYPMCTEIVKRNARDIRDTRVFPQGRWRSTEEHLKSLKEARPDLAPHAPASLTPIQASCEKEHARVVRHIQKKRRHEARTTIVQQAAQGCLACAVWLQLGSALPWRCPLCQPAPEGLVPLSDVTALYAAIEENSKINFI